MHVCNPQAPVLTEPEDELAAALRARLRGPRRHAPAAAGCVERFDRRGTEPFEPFEPFEQFEFFQNRNFPWKIQKFQKINLNFQHFLNYRRNSDTIDQNLSKNHLKEFKNNDFLQNFAKKCENF